MPDIRTVTVLPAGVDPFGSQDTGTVDAPAVGPTTITTTVGPPGPAGAPGGATGGYLHTQAIASTVWTVQHGLGFNPQPVVLNPDGRLVFGWVPSWPSQDVLILTFPVPLAGTTHVS